MSRLSKAVRRIKLGPVVTILTGLAETLLGGGTGAIKKRLVMEAIELIRRRATEAGIEVPSAEVADELVEQTVALGGAQPITVTTEPAPVASVPATPAPAPAKRTRGPNKPKVQPPIAVSPQVPRALEDYEPEPEDELEFDDETGTE